MLTEVNVALARKIPLELHQLSSIRRSAVGRYSSQLWTNLSDRQRRLRHVEVRNHTIGSNEDVSTICADPVDHEWLL